MATNKIITVTTTPTRTSDTVSYYNAYSSVSGLLGTLNVAEASSGKTFGLTTGSTHNITIKTVWTTYGESTTNESNIVVVNLSDTIWDLSTASYDTKSIDISTEATIVQDIFFKDDGLKMYIINNSTYTVYQYNLSVAFDVSTATYAVKSLDLSNEVTGGQSVAGLFISDEGTKLYINNYSNKIVYQYTLSIAWDLATATYSTKSYTALEISGNMGGISIANNGTKLYLYGASAKDIEQYTLGTAWDISTASYDTKNFDASTENTGTSLGIRVSESGDRLLVADLTNNSIHQYNLGTPYDISTAVFNNTLDVSAQNTQVRGVWTNGVKLYVADSGTDIIYQYSL